VRVGKMLSFIYIIIRILLVDAVLLLPSAQV